MIVDIWGGITNGELIIVSITNSTYVKQTVSISVWELNVCKFECNRRYIDSSKKDTGTILSRINVSGLLWWRYKDFCSIGTLVKIRHRSIKYLTWILQFLENRNYKNYTNFIINLFHFSFVKCSVQCRLLQRWRWLFEVHWKYCTIHSRKWHELHDSLWWNN